MNGRYSCLDVDSVVQSDRRLVPLRDKDLLSIMTWRNAQLKLLRQREPLTPAKQEDYYKRVVIPSFTEKYPKQMLFSYLHLDELIGYGGLVHISWEDRRAEVSFLVAPERAADSSVYSQDFSLYLSLIKKTAFQHLGFTRLFTETYDIRSHHINILESNGFLFEGRLKAHVWIDAHPVDSLMHGCVHLPT
jgi:RimJ/RimL family protein N-acetyltransferase